MYRSLIILTLSLLVSCQNEKQDLTKDKPIKRIGQVESELVVSLLSSHKITNNEELMDQLVSLADSLEVDEILISYELKGQFKTIAKITSKSKDLVGLKNKLESLSKVEKASFNYIYEGNPFDSVDVVYVEGKNPIELEAAHHKLIASEKAWQYSQGEGVNVAITDSGIELSHPDLKENLWTNYIEHGLDINGKNKCKNGIDDDGNGKIDDCFGWDFVSNDNDPNFEKNGYAKDHGTHVGGIVSATKNGYGAVGVAPKAKILPLRFYGSGKWTSDIVLQSYLYAITAGSKIINTSYNVDRFADDEVYITAVDAVYDNEILLVNSAGNNSEVNPSRFTVSKVLMVANTSVAKDGTIADKKHFSSNYGYEVDVSAPGDRIYAPISGHSYEEKTGTSMSTPIVSAALALIWSKNPQWSKEQVVARLLATSDSIEELNPDYKMQLGSGRINLERALSNQQQPLSHIMGVSGILEEGRNFIQLQIGGSLDVDSIVDDAFELYILEEDHIGKSNDIIMQKYSSSIPVEVKDRELLSYSSNVIRIGPVSGDLKAGQYLLRVKNHLKDPFSQAIDGNSNGRIDKDDDFYQKIVISLEDKAPPILLGLSTLDKSKLEYRPEDANVNYLLSASDDVSGIQSIKMRVTSKIKSSKTLTIECSKDCEKLDGKYKLSLPVSKFPFDDQYYVSAVEMLDYRGKKISYYGSSYDEYLRPSQDKALERVYPDPKYISVTGIATPDTIKPLLKSISFDKKSVALDKVFTLKLEASDVSGIEFMNFRIRGVSNGRIIPLSARYLEKVYDGEFSLDIKPNKRRKADRYFVDRVSINDFEDNNLILNCKRDLDPPVFEGTDIECPFIELQAF